jgi:hypothetical protein
LRIGTKTMGCGSSDGASEKRMTDRRAGRDTCRVGNADAAQIASTIVRFWHVSAVARPPAGVPTRSTIANARVIKCADGYQLKPDLKT